MRKAGFWIVIAATLAAFIIMFVWTMPRLEAMAGGLLPFDKRPCGYSPAEGKALLDALGAEGRAFYANVQHRLDLVFPGLLALSLVLIFRRLLPGALGMVLSAVALAGAGFDWAENALVAKLLVAGPDLTDAMIEQASRMTVIKSGLIALALTALVVLLLRAGWRWWRARVPV